MCSMKLVCCFGVLLFFGRGFQSTTAAELQTILLTNYHYHSRLVKVC